MFEEVLRKKHGPEMEMCIVYEDQPVNNFMTLFQIVQG